METMTLKVELGALTECLVWESHKRGKNWAACISKDPTAPGGLARRFWTRAKGEYFYIVPGDLQAGIPVEFGADYYTCGGSANRKRRYVVVTEVAADHLTVQIHETAAQAINAAQEFKQALAAPCIRAVETAQEVTA